MIFLEIILLIVGFIFLIKGADLFVDGSSSIAKILNVPAIIIGLTIVALGTSLPELAVSVEASIKGENAIAISNIIGSNLFNLLVVLGACAIIKWIKVNKSVLKREFPFSIIVTAVLLIFAADVIRTEDVIKRIDVLSGEFNKNVVGNVGRIEGIIFIIIFAFFIGISVKKALKVRKESNIAKEYIIPEEKLNREIEEEVPIKELPMSKSIAFVIIGIVAIAVGGELVVDSAKYIADAARVSDTLIGLTIVALGTSLPELVTSIVAGIKGETDLAVGNVIGSNIMNIVLIIGVACTISPISNITMYSISDLVLLIAANVIVFIICIWRKGLGRKSGIAMLGMYAVYLAYIIIR
ncbi:MAG: calcium/sodium antiporter [Eubacterium sp.]